MKHLTSYLFIFLLLLLLYYLYHNYKFKEGYKINYNWHKDKKIHNSDDLHMHPHPWITNKPVYGNVSSYTSDYIPDSVLNAEESGHTCIPTDLYHHERVTRETPNSPNPENTTNPDDIITTLRSLNNTSDSEYTIIHNDSYTNNWEDILRSSDYEYPDNREKFWNKVFEFSGSRLDNDIYKNNSRKYTLWDTVSQIINNKLLGYNFHIDRVIKEKTLGLYAEKIGKEKYIICDHYKSADNYLDEILKDGNGYHTNKETSLKSSSPKPCNSEQDTSDCIFGWKEESLSEWNSIHSEIKNKIKNLKC